MRVNPSLHHVHVPLSGNLHRATYLGSFGSPHLLIPAPVPVLLQHAPLGVVTSGGNLFSPSLEATPSMP